MANANDLTLKGINSESNSPLLKHVHKCPPLVCVKARWADRTQTLGPAGVLCTWSTTGLEAVIGASMFSTGHICVSVCVFMAEKKLLSTSCALPAQQVNLKFYVIIWCGSVLVVTSPLNSPVTEIERSWSFISIFVSELILVTIILQHQNLH